MDDYQLRPGSSGQSPQRLTIARSLEVCSIDGLRDKVQLLIFLCGQDGHSCRASSHQPIKTADGGQHGVDGSQAAFSVFLLFTAAQNTELVLLTEPDSKNEFL